MEDKARVLVVEDEFLIAMATREILECADLEVIGPFSNEAQARRALREEELDGALVDINLGDGRNSFGLASELLDTGVPFAFVTAHSDMDIPDKFRNVPRVIKPASDMSILRAVETFALAHHARPEVVRTAQA
jgi:DNA-binding LytR/AlgR family response regulator